MLQYIQIVHHVQRALIGIVHDYCPCVIWHGNSSIMSHEHEYAHDGTQTVLGHRAAFSLMQQWHDDMFRGKIKFKSLTQLESQSDSLISVHWHPYVFHFPPTRSDLQMRSWWVLFLTYYKICWGFVKWVQVIFITSLHDFICISLCSMIMLNVANYTSQMQFLIL